MQYMLMIYLNEKLATPVPAAAEGRMSEEFAAYTDAMKKAGAFIAGDRLHPTSAATTVRKPDGKVKVLNGPYAETREQLAGYYLIDVPDLDAAISWAGRCPAAAYGSIEVRPVAQYAMADA
jgi:hypothetical protein